MIAAGAKAPAAVFCSIELSDKFNVGNGLDRSEVVRERADWSRPVPTWRGTTPPKNFFKKFLEPLSTFGVLIRSS